MPADDHEETRAEIARRRLADLAASFNATLPDVVDEEEDTDGSVAAASRGFVLLRPTHLTFVAVLSVIALLLVGWWLFAGSESQPQSIAVNQTADSSARSDVATAEATAPEILIVHVVGKVKKPGIVTVPAGSRVDDALAAAGGPKGKVDLTALNLARPLVDGEQVRIGLPPPLDPGSLDQQGSSVPMGDGKVNLNSASATDLETLPGVGPVTAQSIIDWRNKNQKFRTVEDLLDIRGIGEATLERLRPLVTL